jgi:hypothetical protein
MRFLQEILANMIHSGAHNNDSCCKITLQKLTLSPTYLLLVGCNNGGLSASLFVLNLAVTNDIFFLSFFLAGI